MEEEAKEALQELQSGTMNAHFPAMSLQRAIEELGDAGEMERAKRLLKRALKEGESWYLPAPGAFTSAVFRFLAKAVARVEGKEAALALVHLAMERAKGDPKSRWKRSAR